jgi:drug/metabolite transporter (DMT)-like permease
MMCAVPDHPSAHASDRLALLAAALLFSTGGAAVKLTALSGWQVASLRSGIAAVALLLVLPAARRGWSWRTALVGAAYAGTMISYVLANKLTTAANAIFLQSTAPLYILLLGPLLLAEPVRRRHLLFMTALAAGMALFFVGVQPPLATAPDPLRGNLVGALTGLFWALTILGLRWLGRAGARDDTAPSAAPAVACGNLLACAAALPMALPIASATRTNWLVVAFLGVFQIALAYVFMVRGVRGVGALEASLLLLLEPVLTPLWAWLVHGEEPTLWALAGGGIIVAATALFAVTAERAAVPKRSTS